MALFNGVFGPILLKNSEVPESPTLAKKSTSQIALGSTISHAGRGKAPPKTSLKTEVGSFSTELAQSGQPATPIAVMISGEIVVKDRHFTVRDKRSIRENCPRRLNSQVRQAGQNRASHRWLHGLAPVEHLPPGRSSIQVN